MIEHGLNPSEPKRFGYMAFHIVTRRGFTKAVETLLECNVDITAKTSKGETALRIAVEKRYPDIVDLLLKKGAPTDVSDNGDFDILKFAKGESEKPDLQPCDKNTMDNICSFLENPPLVEGPSTPSESPFVSKFPPKELYACPFAQGLSSDDDEFLLTPYMTEACREHRITVAEFFVGEYEDKALSEGHRKEFRNVKSYSVYDVPTATLSTPLLILDQLTKNRTRL